MQMLLKEPGLLNELTRFTSGEEEPRKSGGHTGSQGESRNVKRHLQRGTVQPSVLLGASNVKDGEKAAQNIKQRWREAEGRNHEQFY